MVTEFKGAQFGVKLTPRGDNDPHVCIQLLGEDDEHWFEIGDPFSSFWIDDLIQQLQNAKKALETMPKDRHGYGREFRDEEKKQ